MYDMITLTNQSFIIESYLKLSSCLHFKFPLMSITYSYEIELINKLNWII